MSAELALLDAKVLTMNPSQPRAQAVAVRNSKILKVGANNEITEFIGENTKVIRLKGKTVLPGFIDTHIHVADFGRFLLWMDLSEARSTEEMRRQLGERLQETPKGKWVVGRGWNENRFAEKRLPTRFDLDAVAPNNPVLFYHQNGQVAVANSKALELSGIDKQMAAPPGGAIDRNAGTGEATGILRETATDLVWKLVPEPTDEEIADAASLGVERIVEAGLTSVHWIATSKVDLTVLQKLLASGGLPLRIYMIVPVNLLDHLTSQQGRSSYEVGTVRIGGVEVYADGFLSSKTAALLEPYSDDQTQAPMLCTREDIAALTVKALEGEFQPVIHAMGDKAIDAALAAIKQAAAHATAKGIRTRIDEAAVMSQTLVKRVKQQAVVVSVQPCVMASEFSVYSAMARLGPERARWLYPLKTLFREGVRVCGGSDCPMEPLNPLLGIQAAVSRQFFHEEELTVDEALRMYTVNAAYASCEEKLKGSIEEGKLADLTVLSKDPHEVPRDEISGIAVEMTLTAGKIVYSR